MDKPKTIWNLIAQKPFAALAATVLVVIQAGLNVSEVVVLEHFIDTCANFRWGMALLFAIAIAGIYAYRYIQVPMLEYLNHKVRLQAREYLDDVIISQMVQVSAASLEKTENQALIARLQDEPEKRYANAFFSVLQILGGILGAVGIYSLIAESVPLLLPITLLLLGLMVIAFRLIGKNKVALYQARREISRRSDYLSGLLFERRLAQEKKLFAYTEYVQKQYEEENIKSGKKLLKSIFVSNLILWLYDNITYLFSASAYLLFLIPLYRGEIQIGLYVAIIPALTRLGAFFVEVGSKHLPAYKEYEACRKDVAQIYTLPKQYYACEESGVELPKFQVISGRDIVFRYPGEDKPVINGLNFEFHVGKNYALVGENGCGKTTLIKLLLGFYEPERGDIFIDGKNIRDMEFGKLQRYFSAVFQNFNRYEYSIRENIAFSDLSRGLGEEIQRAAKQAEVDTWVQSCPKQYETQLGKLEEGAVELSGGQWQRLALARSYYRQRPILFFDEPTAAIDPLEEMSIYERLDKLARGRTVVLVTHRLGAVRSADKIIVMEKGRIVEMGSFSELLEQKGCFYYIWKEQTKWYQKE